MIEVDALATCPRCGTAPEFVERDSPVGTHVHCKVACPSCGFHGPGVAQRLVTEVDNLHRAWGRVNAAKEWNLYVRPS